MWVSTPTGDFPLALPRRLPAVCLRNVKIGLKGGINRLKPHRSSAAPRPQNGQRPNSPRTLGAVSAYILSAFIGVSVTSPYNEAPQTPSVRGASRRTSRARPAGAAWAPCVRRQRGAGGAAVGGPCHPGAALHRGQLGAQDPGVSGPQDPRESGPLGLKGSGPLGHRGSGPQGLRTTAPPPPSTNVSHSPHPPGTTRRAPVLPPCPGPLRPLPTGRTGPVPFPTPAALPAAPARGQPQPRASPGPPPQPPRWLLSPRRCSATSGRRLPSLR